MKELEGDSALDALQCWRYPLIGWVALV